MITEEESDQKLNNKSKQNKSLSTSPENMSDEDDSLRESNTISDNQLNTIHSSQSTSNADQKLNEDTVEDDANDFISSVKKAAKVQKQKKIEELEAEKNEIAEEEAKEVTEEANDATKQITEKVENNVQVTDQTGEPNLNENTYNSLFSTPLKKSRSIIRPNKSPRQSLIKLVTDETHKIVSVHPVLPPRRQESLGSNQANSSPSIISNTRSSSGFYESNPFNFHSPKNNETVPQKRNSLIKVAPVNPVPPSLKDELNNPKFLKNLSVISPPTVPSRETAKNSGDAISKITLAYDRERYDKINSSQFLEGQRMPSQGIDISEKIDIIRENSKAVSPDFDMIINRFEINHGLRDLSDVALKGEELLKESFKEVIEHEKETTDSIVFWKEFILNYDSTIKHHPDKLERLIFAEGIPSELRPFVWKFITQSNLKNLEVLYANNAVISSPHASQIEKDIKRTNFISLEKQTMLKNVCLAYSNYDSDLGYTQGLCFIITPLILTLNSEVEVFSLLVKLMHDYNLRSFYVNEMPGLMLKLYQFDKLLQEFSSPIFEHLAECGIISNMFVSQWFLSFFGYKFPYEFVIRIFDIILVEGLEALLKFALVIVIKNKDKILSLKFDELLEFLQDDLFNIYLLKDANEETKDDGLISDGESVLKNELPNYDVSQFVLDAMEIKLMPISLKTLEAEYDEISDLKKTFSSSEKEIEKLKIVNRNQSEELLKVKSSFNVLKKDHELIANELIHKRQVIFSMNDQISDLNEDVVQWQQKYTNMIENSKLSNPDSNIPTDLKEGIDQVLSNNKKVMERNLDLEHQIETLKELVDVLKHSLRTTEETKESKWKIFKK